MNFLSDTVKKNCDFLEKLDNTDLEKECTEFFKEIDNFLNTGSIHYFKDEKENVESTILSTNTRKGRQRKPALADITELNIPITPIHIKKEKLSDVNVPNSIEANIAIKTEAEEMPAPTKLPPRKKKIKTEIIELPKRSTRSRTRTNKVNNSSEDSTNRKKSSDVIIQDTTITTIELSDDKDTETESEAEKNTEVRTTRSKITKNKQRNAEPPTKSKEETKESVRSTRTKRKKRARSHSAEEQTLVAESKKSKSESNDEKDYNGSVQTEYEDAVSTVETNQEKAADVAVNATFVTSSSSSNKDDAPSANCTVVVDNPIMVKSGEDEVDQTQKGSPEPVRKAKGGTKQIFSPYENTPMKKKVEAFEKLGATNSAIPTRTRTKKKLLQKRDSEGKEDNVVDEKAAEKHKGMLTPLMSKFQPKGCSTSKVNKLHPHCAASGDTSTYNESVLSTKSASALKASQAEFREREKRRQEKEREALKKREALLLAQTEEKRRKREEKQQKAQQQREMLEKEKQKQLEAQRVKDEKYKQAMAEREGKLQKQREEAERRRQLAKKKAEQQREEEAKRAAAERQLEAARMAALKQKQQQTLPVYMTTRPPMLPTDDCYDSDDPEYEYVKKTLPAWSREPEVSRQQLAMIVCGESIKNTFFCRQAVTPDLTEIFEHIDPRKLKRTSSAIWRKPPRYTLMPTFQDRPIFSEESD